jgi:hypothetical protein
VAGVVLSAAQQPAGDDPSRDTNRAELERRCVPPVLAELGWQAERFDRDVDWYGTAR